MGAGCCAMAQRKDLHMSKLDMARAWAKDMIDNIGCNRNAMHIWDSHFGQSREQLLSRIGEVQSSTTFDAEYFFDIESMLVDALTDYYEDIMAWKPVKANDAFAFSWDAGERIGWGFKTLRSGKLVQVVCEKLRLAVKKNSYGDTYLRSCYPVE